MTSSHNQHAFDPPNPSSSAFCCCCCGSRALLRWNTIINKKREKNQPNIRSTCKKNFLHNAGEAKIKHTAKTKRINKNVTLNRMKRINVVYSVHIRNSSVEQRSSQGKCSALFGCVCRMLGQGSSSYPQNRLFVWSSLATSTGIKVSMYPIVGKRVSSIRSLPFSLSFTLYLAHTLSLSLCGTVSSQSCIVLYGNVN